MSGLRCIDSTLLVIDMQTKLLPAIRKHRQLLRHAEVLVKGARLLGVPTVATEHCVDKIGPTSPVLLPFIDAVFPKTHFDATREPGFIDFLPAGRPRVLLIGTEAHVCVLQTALGLLEQGVRPVIVADGIGSRHAGDHESTLSRCAFHGIEVVSLEMVLFEWLESAQNPQFKEILALVKSI